MPPIGVIWFFLYYFSFKFLIEKYDFKTPGREDDSVSDSEKNFSDSEQTQLILDGLGGKDNIEDLDCCITRLRVTVKDAALVSDEKLTASGAKGVIKRGVGIQVIYGPQVIAIKNRLDEFLNVH